MTALEGSVGGEALRWAGGRFLRLIWIVLCDGSLERAMTIRGLECGGRANEGGCSLPNSGTTLPNSGTTLLTRSGRLLLTVPLDLPLLELVEKPLCSRRRRGASSPDSARPARGPERLRSAARNRRLLSSSSMIKMRPSYPPRRGRLEEQLEDEANLIRADPPPGVAGTYLIAGMDLHLVAMTPPVDADRPGVVNQRSTRFPFGGRRRNRRGEALVSLISSGSAKYPPRR